VTIESTTEDDWVPILSRENDGETTRFKWGLRSGGTEPTVWEVTGPGDGYPSHHNYLAEAWGTEPKVASGDLFGVATWEPPEITIRAYYSENVPQPVIDWFRERYPAGALV